MESGENKKKDRSKYAIREAPQTQERRGGTFDDREEMT